MSTLLRQTVLPEPVAPAISRCGQSRRSVTIALPETSLPMGRATGEVLLVNSCAVMISLSYTIVVVVLGTSTPTRPFPGMGATTWQLAAFITRARSSDSDTIFVSFTPGAGVSS